jgi:hypothetical protein
VNVSATDAAGNTATGSFTVRVRDTTPPAVAPLTEWKVPARANGTAVLPDFTAAVSVLASDAVGVSSVTQTPAAGTVLGFGTHALLFTASDAAGNGTTVRTTVTVGYARAPGSGFVDSDLDQIDDFWEGQHFGKLTTLRAGTDFDRDRFTDYEEFLRGTDPKVASPRMNQPDGAIGLSLRFMRGKDIYDSLGTGQTLPLELRKRSSKTVLLSVQNDSPARNTVLLRGTASSRAFAIRYYHGTINVTRQVVNGTYRLSNLPPNATRNLKVVVTALAAAPAAARLQ